MNKKSMRLTKDGSAFVITIGNQSEIFDVNLVKYHLGISYTKKDGTLVTEEEIKIKKEFAQKAYLQKIINSNSKASA